jgi:hypothetical protein
MDDYAESSFTKKAWGKGRFHEVSSIEEGRREVVEGLKVGQRKGRATQPLRLSYATSKYCRRGFAVER